MNSKDKNTESRQSSPSLNQVAVIVPARNEKGNLEDCIQSLLAAAKNQAEIIFVNDDSTDGSEEIFEKYSGQVRVLKGRGQGPGKARNLAMKKTDREWIAFTDADCVVDEQWLEKLCESFQDRGQEFVSAGGPQRIHPKAQDEEKINHSFFESIGFVSDYVHDGKRIREVSHNPTCNVIYHRPSLEKMKGFDEKLWPCEDLDLDIRMKEKGYRMLFNPAAVVHHRKPASSQELFNMFNRYGFAHAQLFKKHGVCQKIHWLPILVPAALSFLLAILITEFSAGIALAFTAFTLFFLYFFWRSKNLKWGFHHTLNLVAAVWQWLSGFYSGLHGKRRISIFDE